jgi:hypothetical protein
MQVMAREIFNPNFSLFVPVPMGGSTFQPNPNSVVQNDEARGTNHLDFFKFVGRVVGKALHDGQYIDAYFTRSFYKHMLGQPLTYQVRQRVPPFAWCAECWASYVAASFLKIRGSCMSTKSSNAITACASCTHMLGQPLTCQVSEILALSLPCKLQQSADALLVPAWSREQQFPCFVLPCHLSALHDCCAPRAIGIGSRSQMSFCGYRTLRQ